MHVNASHEQLAVLYTIQGKATRGPVRILNSDIFVNENENYDPFVHEKEN